MIEQDHRFLKRLVKPGMGFFSFQTAQRTFQGYEVMHMIRKGQVQEVNKGDPRSQMAFIFTEVARGIDKRLWSVETSQQSGS